MISNRSVPPDTVLPHVVYRSVEDALAWLGKAFGFREHYHYGEPGGPISGAQVHLCNAWIMLRRARDEEKTPLQLGACTQSLTVFVEEIESHFQRAKSAGAKIVENLHETEYGELQYGAEDLDGHHWLFSRHARDVSPDQWGGTVVERASRVEMLPRPRLCYLQIPAVDPHRSATFYEKVFGWNIRHRDSDHPSFDDASGDVSGACTTDLSPAREPGLLPYIWVDDIDAVLAKVAANGGETVEPRHHDSPDSANWIATFRDPAGNVIGLYQ